MFKEVLTNHRCVKYLVLCIALSAISLLLGYTLASWTYASQTPPETMSQNILTPGQALNTGRLPLVADASPQTCIQPSFSDSELPIILTSLPETIDIYSSVESVLVSVRITSFSYYNSMWRASVKNDDLTYEVAIPECILDDVSVGDSISVYVHGNMVATFAGLDAKYVL